MFGLFAFEKKNNWSSSN